MISLDKLPYVIAITCLYEGRLRLAREVLQRYPNPEEAWERISLPGKSAAWQRAQQELEPTYLCQLPDSLMSRQVSASCHISNTILTCI